MLYFHSNQENCHDNCIDHTNIQMLGTYIYFLQTNFMESNKCRDQIPKRTRIQRVLYIEETNKPIKDNFRLDYLLKW